MKSWKLSYFPIKMKRISILSSSVTLGFVDNFLVIIPFRLFLFFSSPHFYKAIHKGKKNFFPFTFAWLNERRALSSLPLGVVLAFVPIGSYENLLQV
jgi:hypothetical protein